MLGFILLLTAPLLIGGFLVSNVFGDDDDDDETARQQDQDRDDQEANVSNENTLIRDEDVYLANTGEDVLVGGDGVDVYFQNDDVNTEGAPLEINLRGGDDFAEIDRDFRGLDGVVLRGGEGDDILSSDGLQVFIRGGSGDDTITTLDTARVNGGDGNDTIFADARFSRDVDEATFLNGGEGDDDITAARVFNVTSSISNPLVMEGGEGADTFTIEAEYLELFGLSDAEPRPVELRDFATITDFDPEEDKLVIKYQSSSPDVEFSVSNETDFRGQELTLVQFTTSGNTIEEPVVGTVRLLGTIDLDVEDIEFVRTGGLVVGS